MQRLRPRTLLWVRSRRGTVCQGLRTPVGAAGSPLVLPAPATTTPRAAPAAVGARSASTTACVEDRRGGGQRGWRDSGVEHGGGGDRSWAVGRVKRKIAAVVAFCGQRYLGFQFNGDSATVEKALYEAVEQVGGVPPDPHGVRGHPKHIGWARASRTDRGVHAVRNVVSFKMRVLEEDILPSRNCPALAERLNAHLPEDIRVLSAVQATKTFSARHACVTRQYDYFIPQQALSTLASTQGVGTHGTLPSPDAIPAALTAALGGYVGTHSFHNFTSTRVRAATVNMKNGFDSLALRDWSFDPTLMRTIYSFVCDPVPVVLDPANPAASTCWRIRVTGSGFLHHHIRFMIGTAVGIVTGALPPEIISYALSLPCLKPSAGESLPLAPAAPLLLSNQVFRDESLLLMDPPVDEAPIGPRLANNEQLITVMDDGARRTEATFLQDYLLPRMHDIFEHDGVSDIWRHQLEMCSPSQRDLEEMVERFNVWNPQVEKKRQQRRDYKTQYRMRFLQEAWSNPEGFLPQHPHGLPQEYHTILPPGCARELCTGLELHPNTWRLTYVMRACAVRILLGSWPPDTTAEMLPDLVRQAGGVQAMEQEGLQSEESDAAAIANVRKARYARRARNNTRGSHDGHGRASRRGADQS